MRTSAAQQMQQTGGRPKGPTLPVTVQVNFDDTGFESIEYTARLNDTLRFNNMFSSALTVYVLSQDGQSPSMLLLESVSQLNVGGGLAVAQVVKGTGTYLLSLEPSPQLIASNDPGGKTVTVIISA
jgi:hypothetical protein